MFLTVEGIEFLPFADTPSFEPLMRLVKRPAGTGTADTGSCICKRKTIARDMVVKIKKNRYFPSDRVVITVKGGWDITFSIRDKEAFLSCFENIPGMSGGCGPVPARSTDRAACP